MQTLKTIFIVSVTLVLFAGFISCDDDTSITVDNSTLLSDQEIADLQFMHQEERLARDVYGYLFDKYQTMIFDNIGQSEGRHVSYVEGVMEDYNIPIDSPLEAGVYKNETIQNLYNNLIVQGDISLVEALKVGATIEDVDIYDLDRIKATTDNENLVNLYEKLLCGSKNHMRGFTKNINKQDETYTPQYISQTEYEEILQASNGYCG